MTRRKRPSKKDYLQVSFQQIPTITRTYCPTRTVGRHAPSGQRLPSNAGLHLPKLAPNLQTAYNNPLKASVPALKGVIAFLDEKATKHSMRRSIAKRRKREAQGEPIKTLLGVIPFETNIPEIAEEGKLQRTLARLVLEHPFYYPKSRKHMLDILDRQEQFESSAGTSSVAWQQPNTSSTSKKRNPAPSAHWLASHAGLHCPELASDLRMAYDDPLTASVDDLEGVIQFLDKRHNYSNDYQQAVWQWKQETGEKPSRKPRGRKPVETKIPDITDEKTLQRALARLVLEDSFYHPKHKSQMLDILNREEQSQTTSSAASGSQLPNTSLSSQPVPFSTP
ncbi:hypothetical protein H0H93_011157, partial [Arthromyces matolae]